MTQAYLSRRYTLYITPKIILKDKKYTFDYKPTLDIHYPISEDLVDIQKIGGLHILLYDKYNSNSETTYLTRVISNNDSLYQYESEIKSIVQKVNQYLIKDKTISDFNNAGEYVVVINRQVSEKSKILKGLPSQVISEPEIYSWKIFNNTNKIIIYRGSLEDCKEFKTYITSKLVRFLLYLGLVSQQLKNEYSWRFVHIHNRINGISIESCLTTDEVKLIDRYILNFGERKSGDYKVIALRYKSIDVMRDFDETLTKILNTMDEMLSIIKYSLSEDNTMVMKRGLIITIQLEIKPATLKELLRYSENLKDDKITNTLQQVQNLIYNLDINSDISYAKLLDIREELAKLHNLINSL